MTRFVTAASPGLPAGCGDQVRNRLPTDSNPVIGMVCVT